MKLTLLVFLLMGSLGFIVDYMTRQLEGAKGIIETLNKIKPLLNLFVYGTGGLLLFWLTYIPIFKFLNFILLFMGSGAIVCSLVELGYGLLLNKMLKLNLWHYETKIGKIQLNIMGQVDIIHFILWGFISIPVYWLSNLVK
jgi:uncharacterized membrane protein